jgi:glyoxylase-like metal-dependent hydrolase (beta-lactamase superfamily II)
LNHSSEKHIVLAMTSLDDRLRRPAQLRSLRLGDTTVTYLPDGVVQLPATAWLPGTTEDTWATHPEYLDETGSLVASIGGLLVEHDGRALLIDAGFGPHSFPAEPGNTRGAIRGGDLPAGLAAAGRRPEEIDTVAITHLHIDHIGWLTADPSLFAHAAVVVAEPEWTQRHLLHAHGTSPEMLAAMEPRVRTAADGEEIFPGVRLRLAEGHTAGHTTYVVSGEGQRLVAFGDAMHSSIQVDHPDWSAASDHDPVASAAARRRLVAELSEPDTIGFGVHFADVVFGRVRVNGAGPGWEPMVTGGPRV